MKNKSDQFICELCMESVSDYEEHIRIGVDSVVRVPDGSYRSLVNNRVIVFSVFHNECIKSTLDRDDCEDVFYIHEARQMYLSMQTDGVIEHKEPQAQQPKVTRPLVCLNGGKVNLSN